MRDIYVVSKPVHVVSHWGDYGDMLVHGMSIRLPRRDGKLQVERTGPFVPSISFPGIADIVVTDFLRTRLSSAIGGLAFQPVLRARLVCVRWHEWDLSMDEPPELPKSGEPEDYVLARKHDENVSREVGELWELVPAIEPLIQGNDGSFVSAHYHDEHLIRASEMAGYNFISSALKDALSTNAPEEIDFHLAKVAGTA